MEMSERIQRVLQIKGLSQADLCRMANMSTSQVSMLVNGRTEDPRVHTIAPIAVALEASLDYLVLGRRINNEIEDESTRDIKRNCEQLSLEGRQVLLEVSEALVRSGMYRPPAE